MTITLLLILSSFAHADPLGDHLAKMTRMIEKDGREKFCVASVPRSAKYRAGKSFWPTSAACVGDLVFNKGTLKEKVGCTAYVLDLDNLQIIPLNRILGFNMTEGKACDDGGFEALMASRLVADYTAGLDKKPTIIPVSNAFIHPLGIPETYCSVQVVYAQKSVAQSLLNGKTKYESWFDSATTKSNSESKKEDK